MCSELSARLEEYGVPPLDQEASWESLTGTQPADGAQPGTAAAAAAMEPGAQPALAPINTGGSGGAAQQQAADGRASAAATPHGGAGGISSAAATPRGLVAGASLTPRACGSVLTPRGAGVIASAAALSSSIARKAGAAGTSGRGSGMGSSSGDAGAAAAAAAAAGGSSADAAVEALAAALPLRLGGMLRASQQERKGVLGAGGSGSGGSRMGPGFAAVVDDVGEAVDDVVAGSCTP